MKPLKTNKTKCTKEQTDAQVRRRRNKRRKEEQLDQDIARAAFKDMFGEK